MLRRKYFDSVSELVKYTNRDDFTNVKAINIQNDTDSWFGLSRQETCKRAINGDMQLVIQANQLLEQVETPETIDNCYMPSPVGAYVVVPEYLAGFPTPMREKQLTESERAPIRIYSNVAISAGIELSDGLKRGIAITALVMRLQTTHPVELFLCYSTVDMIIECRIGVLPVDISVLAFMLAHPAVCRRMFNLVRVAEHPRYTPGLMKGEETIKHLGIGPKDLYIDSLSIRDDKMLREPIAWINAQVAKFNVGTDNE